ncbi:MAG: hypothetical protein ACTHMS_23650 [Jatrophihabitans sp.]|uniref:hypothetical protein n=1 Tax=Jatrophihabitans sp. TaxID=1932789 RepID=UPI003F818EE5
MSKKKPTGQYNDDGSYGCEQCGQTHRNPQGRRVCSKHKSPNRGGGPCSAPAMRGLDCCRTHGGMARQARAAGEHRADIEDTRRKAEQKLRALAFRASGEPVPADVDPSDIVAQQLVIRLARVQWFAAQVGEVIERDPRGLVWGRTKKKVGGDDHGTTSEAKPNAWYVLFAEAERDLERLSLEAMKVGLEERRVRLAESHAEMLVRVLDAVLVDLGHDPNDPETAAVVERHLRIAV